MVDLAKYFNLWSMRQMIGLSFEKMFKLFFSLEGIGKMVGNILLRGITVNESCLVISSCQNPLV